jgi:hypothetical protein
MDAFDFLDDEEVVQPKKSKSKRSRPKLKLDFGSALWNVGTLYFVVSTICVASFFFTIWLQPYSGVNPWPPPLPTLPAEATLPQPTETEFAGPPATPTFLPTATVAPTGTVVLLPTSTGVVFGTPTPTSENASEFAYQLQAGNPINLSSTIFHPDLACGFIGVGGQAIDKNSAPVIGYTVQLTGTVDGASIDLLTFTGAATQYGPGGYEIKIADAPFNSTGKLFVQLLDQQGYALSPLIPFDTVDDCGKNIILINFVEVR